MSASKKVSGRQAYMSYRATICCLVFFLLFTGCVFFNFSIFTNVIVTPDGNTIVATESSESGTFQIHVYDALNLREIRFLNSDGVKIFKNSFLFGRRPLAISFDGKFVAAAGRGNSVDVWDLASGRQVAYFPQLTGAMAIAFSPTANILAAAGPTNDTTLWTVPEGKLVAILRGKPTSPNTAVAFSPDSKTLAKGDANRTVRLWALPEGKETGKLEGNARWVHSLSFFPDGRALAVYAGELKFWRLPEFSALPLPSELQDLAVTTIRRTARGIFSRWPVICLHSIVSIQFLRIKG